MTFNAASRLQSLEDRSAALGSRRCELPGMHSVPKSAVLPYASGVGGLSRRLLSKDLTFRVILACKKPEGVKVGYWRAKCFALCCSNIHLVVTTASARFSELGMQ